LVGAFCEEGPVLLLFDDLQWADELTLGVLGLMTESWLDDRPVLLLATCRSDDGPPRLASILESPGVARVRLGPLGDASLRDLVADMLGVAEPPDAIVTFIARRADGNPFVAAEYLRLLVNELPVRREFSLPAIRIVAPSPESLDALRTPGSVRELVARRIEILDDACRGLAELIAVLGGSIDATVYGSLCEDLAARDALFELDRRQLTEATDDGGRRLPHDRVRVVVYDMIAPPRRRELHRDAALLLSRGPTRDPSDVPHVALARHFLAAGMSEAALPHLESAGEQALSRAAYGAAADHFRNVLTTSTALAGAGASFEPARRVRWAYGAARAAFGSGDVDGCEAHVRQALSLVGRSLPRSRAGWPLLAIAEALKTGAEGMAPRMGTGAVRASVPVDAAYASTLADVAQATSLLPYRYFFEEDLVPLVASALLAANLARAADLAKVLPAPSSMLAAMLGLARLAGPARRFFDRAESAAVAAGDWREAATAYALESIYEGSFARWDAAEKAAQSAARACEHSSDPWLRENVETTLSHVEFFTGRFDDARRRAEFLAQSAIGRQNIQHEIWGLFLQARSDIPRARYTDARTLLEAALARLETRPESISEIACRGMLSHVLWNQGETARAQSLADHVNRLVKAKLPPAYPSLVGYAAAAHVHRAALEASPSRDRWRAATELGLGLWRFTAVFPVAAPAAHLHTAHLLRLAGWRAASHALFVRGAARAKRCGMPREHGLLLLGAAQTDDAPAGQSHLLREAERILDSIRCSSQMF
ncbi:MAG TPA: hypothetical protein VH044_08110, partial [Polyangiaceae bacterium]|nr:hypothetical protein [Polyangiaceae bacterium]